MDFDKKQLLADMCAKLPYCLKCEINGKVETLDSICDDDGYYFNFIGEDKEGYTLDEVKPYLFPMSSMTEEQYDEMYNYCYNAEREASKFSNGELKIIYTYELIKFDWLNRNRFDYRGLIPKGLAKDATGLNIY